MSLDKILRVRISDQLDEDVNELADFYGMKRTDFVRRVLEYIRTEQPDLNIVYKGKEDAPMMTVA